MILSVRNEQTGSPGRQLTRSVKTGHPHKRKPSRPKSVGRNSFGRYLRRVSCGRRSVSFRRKVTLSCRPLLRLGVQPVERCHSNRSGVQSIYPSSLMSKSPVPGGSRLMRTGHKNEKALRARQRSRAVMGFLETVCCPESSHGQNHTPNTAPLRVPFGP